MADITSLSRRVENLEHFSVVELPRTIERLKTNLEAVDEAAAGTLGRLHARLIKLECQEDCAPCIADHQLQLDHLHDVQQGILNRLARIECQIPELFDPEPVQEA